MVLKLDMEDDQYYASQVFERIGQSIYNATS